MLLQGNQIEPSEQKNVLDRLKSDQGKLEAEYMHAKEEHNAFRRRNSLLSGGGDMTFDPDRAIEGEIFQLGMKLEDVAEIVQVSLCVKVENRTTRCSLRVPSRILWNQYLVGNIFHM